MGNEEEERCGEDSTNGCLHRKIKNRFDVRLYAVSIFTHSFSSNFSLISTFAVSYSIMKLISSI